LLEDEQYEVIHRSKGVAYPIINCTSGCVYCKGVCIDGGHPEQ